MVVSIILYLCLIVGTIIFAAFYRYYFPLVILLLEIIMPIILFIVTLIEKLLLEVRINSKFNVFKKGADIPIDIAIDNKSIFPISKIIFNVICRDRYGNEFSFNIQTVSNAKSITNITYNIDAKYCGNIDIFIEYVYIYDYLSIFKFKKKINKRSSITILPNVYNMDNDIVIHEVVSDEGERYSQYMRGEDTSEIFDIRDYVQGDKLNRVHWKLSSKYDKMIVKEFGYPLSTKIELLLELYVDKSQDCCKIVDGLIETLASVSYSLIQKGHEHNILWYREDIRELVSERIASREDFERTMRHILNSNVYKDDIKLLPLCSDKLIARQEDGAIYFTSVYNAMDKYSQLNTIVVTDIKDDEVSIDSENMRNISIIDVNNIEGDINRLII